MNVVCSICKDQLVQTDNIFYTRCSHVFHYNCLNQWLERSKSCPQCREKVTQNRIHRLYFTFSNNERVEPHTSTLQERIDNLKFKILLKEKDIQHSRSKNLTLEKQNVGLRQEVRKVETEIGKQNCVIHELREHTKYHDNLKKELDQLKHRVEKMKPIETLLRGPISDVSKMVGNSRDPEILIKYISVMKKELIEILGKRKQSSMTIKSLQEEVTKVKAKCDSMLEERMELEEKVALSESKSMSLQQRVDELEEILGINEKFNNTSDLEKSETKNNVSKKSPREKISKREHNNQEASSKSSTPTKRKKKKISVCDTRNIEDKTAVLHIENDSINSDMNLSNCSSSNDTSMAPKRSRISSDDRNTLNESNGSKITNIMPKKKRESSKTQTSATRDKQNDVIDLT
ncbi:E3 ubiquitin-protein ligase trul-1 isoform X2 [Andrena cerasifolii]|uniref:E3 ubiquitin-protein ligase trul-1 isoform X2 n=1 Tax=Andrena cerasifolii TaxID=2819439 RepID=UPI004037E1A3